MTRKRFVKKLMACGLSRNEVQRVALDRPNWLSFQRYYPYAALRLSAAVALRCLAKATQALVLFGDAVRDPLGIFQAGTEVTPDE